MCGICGKVTSDQNGTIEPGLLRAMLASIRHRGPDDEGMHIAGPVGLGHRRLSIIDLSGGHQPLSNEDGTVWIVFNGEIYNFRELRAWLLSKGHVFRTHTDTEVIIHLYEELGPSCLDRLRGMFAFAIWDGHQKSLFLARDRVGIKPLYYCLTNTSLVFGSEIKALLADPSVGREIAAEQIDRFLTFHYLPGEDTLLKRVKKLAPGHYLLYNSGQTVVRKYWDLDFAKPKTHSSPADAGAQLLHLLQETVDLHMISDVPVGVLLSGGVDSTAVLSLAAEKAPTALRSYTIGFSSPDIADERPYARLAAQAFGSQHNEITISAADFADFMPRYLWHMEEPVCEPPAVALYYVSKLAGTQVKVLLSGEGGDEAFAGYSNYRNLLWLERLKTGLGPLAGVAGPALSLLSAFVRLPRINKYSALVRASFPEYYLSRTSHLGVRHTSRGDATHADALYSPDFGRSLDFTCTIAPLRQYHARVRGENTLDAMLYIDSKTWLPDDLLIKADRMTMANSVELRVPLLDHKILEFAAGLPPNLKVRGCTTKYLAKRVLKSRVPHQILNRPKAGFPIPYNNWLGNELRNWTRDILLDSRTLGRGYFNPRYLERLLSAKRPDENRSKEIFALVTLELWHRHFAEAPGLQDVRHARTS